LPRYKKTSATGDAGEYYFAYWVTRHFGFPCRMQSVDLGIDALIELTNEKKDVKGELISVQIKTSCFPRYDKKTKKDIDTVNLKKQFNVSHLEYWDSCHLPVILVYIVFDNNEEPRMYVRNIKDDYIQNIIAELKPRQQRKEITFVESQQIDMNYMKNLKDLYAIPKELLKACKKIEDVWQGISHTLTVEDINNVTLGGKENFNDDHLIDGFSDMCIYNQSIFDIVLGRPTLRKLSEVIAADDTYTTLQNAIICLMNLRKRGEHRTIYKEEWENKRGLHPEVRAMISESFNG
jgi:hypothetical protein